MATEIRGRLSTEICLKYLVSGYIKTKCLNLNDINYPIDYPARLKFMFQPWQWSSYKFSKFNINPIHNAKYIHTHK